MSSVLLSACAQPDLRCSSSSSSVFTASFAGPQGSGGEGEFRGGTGCTFAGCCCCSTWSLTMQQQGQHLLALLLYTLPCILRLSPHISCLAATICSQGLKGSSKLTRLRSGHWRLHCTHSITVSQMATQWLHQKLTDSSSSKTEQGVKTICGPEMQSVPAGSCSLWIAQCMHLPCSVVRTGDEQTQSMPWGKAACRLQRCSRV